MNVKVLVTGANGQLGISIKERCTKNSLGLDVIFLNKEELNITNKEEILDVFSKENFDYCINCAAFTNVDQAEEMVEIANQVNAEGVKKIAEVCKFKNVVLIHVSTDYIFDGNKGTPYNVDDIPSPVNEYGKSKLRGEQYLKTILKHYFIIRTSWLYSEFGHNFMNTILSLSRNKHEIKVVNDQVGSPTYASDLAQFILKIIIERSKDYGVYHFSNLGDTNWYIFAREIVQLSNGPIENLKSITTKEFGAIAERPRFNVLDNSKTLEVFDVIIPKWKSSLEKALKNI